jgi:hypothetical protein
MRNSHVSATLVFRVTFILDPLMFSRLLLSYDIQNNNLTNGKENDFGLWSNVTDQARLGVFT